MKISTRNLFKRLLGRTEFPFIRPIVFIAPGEVPSPAALDDGYQCAGCGHVYDERGNWYMDEQDSLCMNCSHDIVKKVVNSK
jgi:DNA-directed RNA polymerase subunit RPC12/RpoP